MKSDGNRNKVISAIIIMMTAVCILLFVCNACLAESGTPLEGQSKFGPLPEKKLIEFGWDMPTPSYVADNIRKMERRPFDGVVMRILPICDVFNTRTVDEKELKVEKSATCDARHHKLLLII